MNRLIFLPILANSLLLASPVSAHTLFIKSDSHYVTDGNSIDIQLVNGTYINSETNTSAKKRGKFSVISPDGEETIPRDLKWKNEGKITRTRLKLNSSGVYFAGVTTKTAKIHMTPEDFDFYLRYEGLTDQHKKLYGSDIVDRGVIERYTKFAKSVLKVGDDSSIYTPREFGHKVEIIPLENPLELEVGEEITFKLLKNGEPLPDTSVYASRTDHYKANDEGIIDELISTHSDANGISSFTLDKAGQWYIRFIDLRRTDETEYWYTPILNWLDIEEPRYLYESNWATLTFEIK